MSEIVLHGSWRSSSTHRVRIGLALKGVPHRLQSVHLGRREQLDAPFLGVNPAGQVPVLEHDGMVLTQSVAILRYLDLQWPEPLLFPAEPRDAARVWEIVERVNSFIQPFQMPGTVRRALIAHLDLAPEQAAAGIAAFVPAQLTAALRLLEAHVGGTCGDFCVGDRLTAADVVVVPQLDGAERMGVDLTDLPILRGIRARCLRLNAFQVAAPWAQPDAPERG
jgi:maleylacetoacetate isomerase